MLWSLPAPSDTCQPIDGQARAEDGRKQEIFGGGGECYNAKGQMTAEFGFWQKSTSGTDSKQEDQVPSTKA